MSDTRSAISLLLLLSLTGCAKLMLPGESPPFSAARSRAADELVSGARPSDNEPHSFRVTDRDLPARATDDGLQRRLEVLRTSDPVKYELAREVVQLSNEAASSPQRQLVDQQLRAILNRAYAHDNPGLLPAGESQRAVQQTSHQADAAPQHAPRSAPPTTPPKPTPLPEARTQVVTSSPAAPVIPSSTAVDQTPAALPTGASSRSAATTVAASPAELASPPEPPRDSTEMTTAKAATAIEQPENVAPAPELEWEEVLPTLIQALESDPATLEEGAAAVQQQVFLRLLYLIANRRDDAVEPVDRLPENDREFVKHAIYSLMVWLDRDERHVSSRKAALSLRELRAAADYLANYSTLDLRNAVFCSEVMSYGDYRRFKSTSFRPGAEVVLYVEIENFVSEPVGNRFETELQGDYAILDAGGRRVSSKVLPLDKQQCDNRRRDYFIAYRLWLPQDIPSGGYSLVLTIEDVKGNKSNQATVDFRIR